LPYWNFGPMYCFIKLSPSAFHKISLTWIIRQMSPWSFVWPDFLDTRGTAQQSRNQESTAETQRKNSFLNIRSAFSALLYGPT
jgi:hypothetical protein